MLSQVKDLATREDSDDAIAFIYSEVDALLRKGEFGVVANLLSAIAPSEFDFVCLLGFVSITRAARVPLAEARSTFVARVRSHIAQRDPNRVDELLLGLE